MPQSLASGLAIWCDRCLDSQVSVPRTAIVPAAGLGTRFLPATKTVPKELLPVVDTPGIELVAAEAAEAGAERLVIITSEGKDGVVAHFVEDLVLEGTLEARGKKLDAGEGPPRAGADQSRVCGAGRAARPWARDQLRRAGAGRRRRRGRGACCPTTWCCRPACWRRCRRCAPQFGGTVLCAIEVTPRRDQRLRRFRRRAGARSRHGRAEGQRHGGKAEPGGRAVAVRRGRPLRP